jgi:dipeptidyl aminopeptidase/acylaminoacyl peptidase
MAGHHHAEGEPFNFQINVGKDQYQIEGYLALAHEPGRSPALLVINPNAGNAERCIVSSRYLTDLGIHVACVSIPGYGASSGPGRFFGPQAVSAARKALDMLAERDDVDPTRLGVWGLSNGAMVAGLVMDSDPRPRAVVLESGTYDMLGFWPKAPLLTKLAILREVWPSRRVLKERSVIAQLPLRLDCNVLIIHGANDRNAPVLQAQRLEKELRRRGAHVQTFYLPGGRPGRVVEQPLEAFLRDKLIETNPQSALAD